MKCVVFYQYNKLGEAARFYEALTLEREKYPDKFPKQVTPTYGVVGDIPELKEKLHGFYIVEAESEE